mgnify:CR=1 FL=1
MGIASKLIKFKLLKKATIITKSIRGRTKAQILIGLEQPKSGQVPCLP